MNRKKTANQVELDTKYLRFLADVFTKTSKAYTKISIAALCDVHKVDGVATAALLELGWLSKMKDTPNYYWRGPFPNDEMAEQIRAKILRIKQLRALNLKNLKTPTNSNGKKLIPIEKTTSPLHIRYGAQERYMKLLQELYVTFGVQPTQKSMTEILTRHHVSKGVSAVLKDMGVLVKTKEGLKYNGPGVVHLAFVDEVILAVNKTMKTKPKGEVKVEGSKGWIPERFKHLVETKIEKPVTHEVVQAAMNAVSKSVRVPKVVRDGTVKKPTLAAHLRECNEKNKKEECELKLEVKSDKDLKKSIALKLIQLGELEKADELLSQII